MEIFASVGFMFGLIAFVMVGKLGKDVKILQRQLDDLKKQLSVTSDPT